MSNINGKPPKEFMTKGAERVLTLFFVVPLIILLGTFLVLGIVEALS